MIWESSYWKGDLLRRGRMLRLRAQQRRWPEASLAKVELVLMTGFYVVRKLIEAKKLSDSLVVKQIQVREFTPTGKAVHLFDWHHIDRLYNLEKAKKTQISTSRLCDLFVHSYIFVLSFDSKRRPTGVFFTSDRTRRSRLYYIELKAIIDLFEQVGRDYTTSGSFTWNDKTLDYEVKNN